MEENVIRIKCPACGAEYMPGEIYMPDSFLGRPRNVERDCYKKIVFAGENARMDLDETFVCENCNSPFSVHANVSFVTRGNSRLNPNEDYCTELNSAKKVDITLSEE